MRRVTLPPRVLRLRAARDGCWVASCDGLNVHGPWKLDIERLASTRLCSFYSPSRAAAHDLASDEKKAIGSQLGRQFSQQAKNLNLPAIRYLNLRETSASNSNVFRRVLRRSHENGGQKPNLRNTPLDEEALLLVCRSSKNDRHVNGASRPGHPSSFSGIGNLSFPQSKEHDINGSLGLTPGSNSGHSGASIGQHRASRFPLLQTTSSLHDPESTTAAVAARIRMPHVKGETRSRCYPMQHIRNFSRQTKDTFPRLPTNLRGDSTSSVTKQRMRLCMRRVPQAASIITAADVSDSQNTFRGATVSSFTTVTFEPEVIVSFNLKIPSATFDVIQTSHHFEVNMLKPTDTGAELAFRFARGHAASPFGEAGQGASTESVRRAQGSDHTFASILSQEHGIHNAVAFRISCHYMPEKTVRLGDHVVIFATVDTVPENGDDLGVEEYNTCLAYVNGCYGRIEPLLKQPQDESHQKNTSI